jgi:hypothetical protein
MDIALYRNHFRGFPAFYDRRRAGRLRLIPGNVARHGIRQRVNVVGGLIAGDYFEFLLGIQSQHMGRIHAILLIEDRLSSLNIGSSTPALNIENHIFQAAAGSDYDGFHVCRVAGVSLGAVGIFRHIDTPHVGCGTVELNASANLTFASRVDVLVQDQSSTTN